MSTHKVPHGDPELLPKGTVRRPSAERQPFTSSGELKPGGPGPLTEERFYDAPDLERIPQWTRTRGNEWTTATFRQVVFNWLISFFDARSWAATWDVKEVASAVRSVGRLADDKQHLVIGIVSKDGKRHETSVAFPLNSRDAVRGLAILKKAETALDALQAGV